MKILGISGRISSGKTTVAKLVAQNWFATIQSFATPIKEISNLLGGSSLGSTNKELISPFSIDYRTLYQRIGTECFRELIHPDCWLRVMTLRLAQLARIWHNNSNFDIEGKWFESLCNALKTTNLRIVIDDVRFVNEIQWIESLGGVVVRLLGGKTDSDHVSETELDNYPFQLTINNTYKTPEETTKEILHYLTLREGAQHD